MQCSLLKVQSLQPKDTLGHTTVVWQGNSEGQNGEQELIPAPTPTPATFQQGLQFTPSRGQEDGLLS